MPLRSEFQGEFGFCAVPKLAALAEQMSSSLDVLV